MMPSYTFREEHESATYNVSVDFVVLNWGYPSNNWDDPGAAPEIMIEAAAVWCDSSPDGVTVYSTDNPWSAEDDERWTDIILEQFDFDREASALDEDAYLAERDL